MIVRAKRTALLGVVGLVGVVAGCSLPSTILIADAASDLGTDRTDAAVGDAPGRMDVLDARMDVSAEASVDGHSDVAAIDAASVVAPRPISPPSGSIQTNQHVTLRWALPSGTDGALVELCLTRACSMVTSVTVTTGDSTVDLMPGQTHREWNYWRVRGTAAGVISTTASPVWQFYVPPNVSATSTVHSSHYGAILDWNGDGIPDLAVGAPGSVYLYTGSTTGYGSSPSATLSPPSSVDAGLNRFGSLVASAGDVDGNGFADLVVIEQGSTSGLGTPAHAYVYHSDGTGYPNAPDDVMFNSRNTVQSVSWAGDMDRDGYGDIVVGTIEGPSLNHDSGQLWVIRGSSGPVVTPPIQFSLTGALGYVAGVSGAGDINGDTYDDIVLANGNYVPDQGTGAYVFAGGATLGGALAYAIMDSAQEHFYGAVTAGCDFDQDGWPDVAFSVFGNASGIERFHSSGVGDYSEQFLDNTLLYSDSINALACAGNLSGNGNDDLVFTIPAANGNAGLHVLDAVRGTPTNASVGLVVLDAQLGNAVTVLGDYDHDGLADIAIGGGGGNVAIVRGSSTAPYLNTCANVDLLQQGGAMFGQSVAFGVALPTVVWPLCVPENRTRSLAL